jgi:hypothetical protein
MTGWCGESGYSESKATDRDGPDDPPDEAQEVAEVGRTADARVDLDAHVFAVEPWALGVLADHHGLLTRRGVVFALDVELARDLEHGDEVALEVAAGQRAVLVDPRDTLVGPIRDELVLADLPLDLLHVGFEADEGARETRAGIGLDDRLFVIPVFLEEGLRDVTGLDEVHILHRLAAGREQEGAAGDRGDGRESPVGHGVLVSHGRRPSHFPRSMTERRKRMSSMMLR